MLLESKALFSKSILFSFLAFTVISSSLFIIYNVSWAAYLMVTTYLVLLIVVFFLGSNKISIDGSDIYMGRKKYSLHQDLKSYKIKNEKFTFRGVRFNYQIFALYFKDQEVIVISSRSYSNYNDIKEYLLNILES